MKNYQKLLTAVSISLCTALPVQALDVPTPFAGGDPLTATRMEEVRDAINDNDARAIVNEGNITANTTALSNLFAGDGSAGDLTIDASINWANTPPTNPYFANITIDAGQTLTVPAGTTIFCSGDFTNNGTINVEIGARNRGTNYSSGGAPSSGPKGTAHPGDSFASATLGTFHDNSVSNPSNVNAGVGGIAIPESTARSSFAQFRIGGGAGAGAVSSGGGGGLIKIYCSGTITNNNLIQANGSSGSGSVGGGGGGIVVLASTTLVDNTTGAINVIGGAGGNGGSSFGNSGGGGGGIVIMLSPTAPIEGSTDVSGGTGATTVFTSTSVGRYAGSGGGASGGNGGNGGSFASTGAANAASDGSLGYIITMTVNPAFMIN